MITKSTPKCLKSASSSSKSNITADNVGRQLPFYSKRDVTLPRYSYFCLDCENCPTAATDYGDDDRDRCDHTSHPRRPLRDTIQ